MFSGLLLSINNNLTRVLQVDFGIRQGIPDAYTTIL